MNQGLGSLIDTLYALQVERRQLMKLAQEIAQQEKNIEEQIFNMLDSSGIDSAKSKTASFSIVDFYVPKIVDWKALLHFSINKDLDILSKKVSRPLWEEYRMDGVLVPGTEDVLLKKFSLRKI